MPFSPNLQDRELNKFVESPTRLNQTAVEVIPTNSISTPLFVHVVNQTAGGGGTNANTETRNAGELISALKCVYSFDSNTVKIASSFNTLQQARAIGVAITSAILNESMQFQTYGTLRDTSFTFAANEQLYVSSNGSITNIAPITGYRTVIGTAQGLGSIFINIQETIIL